MPIFDLHCDTLWKVYKDFQKEELTSLLQNSYHIDLNKLKVGGIGLQCFAIFNYPEDKTPFNSANSMIDILQNNLFGREDIKIVYSYQEIVSNLKK